MLVHVLSVVRLLFRAIVKYGTKSTTYCICSHIL